VNVGKWSVINAARALLFGTAFGTAPYYGENAHAGRRIEQGFQAGLLIY
jgi:hypothetical protein